MILHASSDAKKGKLITTPPHAPKKEKNYSTFTLNKAAIILCFLRDSSLSSSPAMLIKKKKNLNSSHLKQQLNGLSLYYDTEKS